MDELDENGNWVVNAVAPNKSFLNNINKDRVCQVTDLNGVSRQARGYAGFAFNAMTSTADKEILRPVEDIFNAATRGALPLPADGPGWPDISLHCLQINSPDGLPAIAPFIHPVDNLKKGLFSLGHLSRCVTPADEFSSCGDNPGSLCVEYGMHGPIKLGYLYGFAGDPLYKKLDQSMTFFSKGGCKLSIEGSSGTGAIIPYSEGFSQVGSTLPYDNSIKTSVPSESFIVLDGSRAIRVRLTSWFAVISDVAYQNNFGLLDTYINASCYEFSDNPYVYGGDPENPDWKSGVEWYTFNDQGQVFFGNTIEHIGGHSYWVTKKWFSELHPQLSFINLHVLIKIWYALPPLGGTDYYADPIPDPWASEYFASDYAVNSTATRGTRPPDEVIWMKMHEVTTCHATGDPLFNVDPEYTMNQGYRFSTSQSVNNILYMHFTYYYKDVIVGQKYQQNFSPRTQYFPSDILQNTLVNEGCGSNSSPYPSQANVNMYPYGQLGQNTFQPLHVMIYNRSGLTITFKAVYAPNFGDYTIDYGDGSQPQQIAYGTNTEHIYQSSGFYEVKISTNNPIGSYSSSTFFTVSE